MSGQDGETVTATAAGFSALGLLSAAASALRELVDYTTRLQAAEAAAGAVRVCKLGLALNSGSQATGSGTAISALATPCSIPQWARCVCWRKNSTPLARAHVGGAGGVAAPHDRP